MKPSCEKNLTTTQHTPEYINILHLSDLHFGIENSFTISQERKDRTKEAYQCLTASLRDLPSEWKPHLIVISGDIGWAGKPADYTQAWEWLILMM